MTPLCEYSSLNDCAITSFVEGDCSQASSLLLKCIKQLHHQSNTSTRRPAVSSSKEVKKFRCIHLPHTVYSDIVSPGNMFEFYPLMFSLPPPTHNVSVEMFEDMLVSVMMFNLAVLHQQTAMRTGCSRRMKCALHLYQLAVGVLKQWYTAESAKLVLLCASANMAQIHGHFYNMNRANACFQLACKLLEHVEHYLSEEIVEGLVTRTNMVPIGLSGAPAA